MAQTSLTTSVGALSVAAENHSVFSLDLAEHDTAFDEGPFIQRKGTIVDASSGSLSYLSSSYPFVQGIEITRQAQYVAGLVKIWSGDPHHRLKPTVIGQERVFFTSSCYVDVDRFSALSFVRDGYRSFTNDDNDVIESHNLNGTIEPLTIRSWSLRETKTIKASLMAGSPDSGGSACDVRSVDVSSLPIIISPFIDGTIKGQETNVLKAVLVPFADARLVRNVPAVSSEPSEIVSALSVMTGSSTSEYIRYDQRSAPCGWCYDNTINQGTDSLAFGGMTY